MEAMALGLPCISTDCKPGGSRTLIQNGINGYITPIGDVDALAKRMSALLENGDEAEAMGQNARNIRYTHSSDEIFVRWNRFIQTIEIGSEFVE